MGHPQPRLKKTGRSRIIKDGNEIGRISPPASSSVDSLCLQWNKGAGGGGSNDKVTVPSQIDNDLRVNRPIVKLLEKTPNRVETVQLRRVSQRRFYGKNGSDEEVVTNKEEEEPTTKAVHRGGRWRPPRPPKSSKVADKFRAHVRSKSPSHYIAHKESPLTLPDKATRKFPPTTPPGVPKRIQTSPPTKPSNIEFHFSCPFKTALNDGQPWKKKTHLRVENPKISNEQIQSPINNNGYDSSNKSENYDCNSDTQESASSSFRDFFLSLASQRGIDEKTLTPELVHRFSQALQRVDNAVNNTTERSGEDEELIDLIKQAGECLPLVLHNRNDRKNNSNTYSKTERTNVQQITTHNDQNQHESEPCTKYYTNNHDEEDDKLAFPRMEDNNVDQIRSEPPQRSPIPQYDTGFDFDIPPSFDIVQQDSIGRREKENASYVSKMTSVVPSVPKTDCSVGQMFHDSSNISVLEPKKKLAIDPPSSIDSTQIGEKAEGRSIKEPRIKNADIVSDSWEIHQLKSREKEIEHLLEIREQEFLEFRKSQNDKKEEDFVFLRLQDAIEEGSKLCGAYNANEDEGITNINTASKMKGLISEVMQGTTPWSELQKPFAEYIRSMPRASGGNEAKEEAGDSLTDFTKVSEQSNVSASEILTIAKDLTARYLDEPDNISKDKLMQLGLHFAKAGGGSSKRNVAHLANKKMPVKNNNKKVEARTHSRRPSTKDPDGVEFGATRNIPACGIRQKRDPDGFGIPESMNRLYSAQAAQNTQEQNIRTDYKDPDEDSIIEKLIQGRVHREETKQDPDGRNLHILEFQVFPHGATPERGEPVQSIAKSTNEIRLRTCTEVEASVSSSGNKLLKGDPDGVSFTDSNWVEKGIDHDCIQTEKSYHTNSTQIRENIDEQIFIEMGADDEEHTTIQDTTHSKVMKIKDELAEENVADYELEIEKMKRTIAQFKEQILSGENETEQNTGEQDTMYNSGNADGTYIYAIPNYYKLRERKLRGSNSDGGESFYADTSIESDEELVEHLKMLLSESKESSFATKSDRKMISNQADIKKHDSVETSIKYIEDDQTILSDLSIETSYNSSNEDSEIMQYLHNMITKTDFDAKERRRNV